MSTLGKRLTKLLAEKNIAQNELGRLAGLSSGEVNKYANDLKKRPVYERVKAMADILGVDVEWLLYGTESGGEEQAPAPVRVKTDRRVVYDDRYPNRDAAIAIYEGIAPPAVIKSVMSKSLKSPEDMPYTYWCKMIEELMAERKRAEAGISVERRDVDPTTLDLHIQPKTRYIIAYSRTLIDLITPSQTWPM